MPTALCMSQMVDLALGTPELGAVNFNVLHTLLHAMLQKLDIGTVKADLSDEDRAMLSGDRKEGSIAGDSGIADSSRTPSPAYHALQTKVTKLQQQIEALNDLPSNDELLGKKSDSAQSSRPVSDMWQTMQINRRVDSNEDGVNKLMTLVDDMMKEVNDLKSANEDMKKQMENLSALDDMKDLMKRLEQLESNVTSLKDQVDGQEFVTWPALEDAMKGIRQELRPRTPQERVVIEMSVQTELPSRPTSSRMSTPGPSLELQNVLERLGMLSDQHDTLETRVDDIEEQLKNKADKESLDALNVPDDLLKQIKDMSDQLSMLKKLQNKLNALDETLSSLQTTYPPLRTPLPAIIASNLDLDNKNINDDLEERLLALQNEVASVHANVEAAESKANTKLSDSLELSEENLDSNNSSNKPNSVLSNGVNNDDEIANGLSAAKGFSADLDSDALSRMQQVILQLQAEVEKVSIVSKELTDENGEQQKHIDTLYSICSKLEDHKADKDFVQSEVDVKADKTHLDGKVNRSIFDQTTDELNKMINDILSKMLGHEDEWKRAVDQLSNDVDGKLDRLEFGPIKDELEKQLKALRRKLAQLDMFDGGPDGDDAAGLRKQLVQRFHCISCDRPVDMMPQGPVPSIPIPNAMPMTKTTRPYTTFELEQIRQHSKSVVQPFESTTRACGGGHTVTYPHHKSTRVPQINSVYREEQAPLYSKEETDIRGNDGHIYKGRMQDEMMFPNLNRQGNAAITAPKQSAESPKTPRKQVAAQIGLRSTTPSSISMRPSGTVRPSSARSTPRPGSARGRITDDTAPPPTKPFVPATEIPVAPPVETVIDAPHPPNGGPPITASST